MARDGVEDVLVARAEDDVRADAGRGLGNARGDGRGVPLAAGFRLAAGHVPLPVVLCGRPVRMGIAPLVRGCEPPGGMLVAGGVGDDRGFAPVRQQDHVGRAARGERGRLEQVRQRPDPDPRCGRAVRQSPGEQHLAMRRDHDRGAAGQRVPGAGGERLGGTLIGTERARLAGGIGQGNVPGILRFRHRIRHLDRGRGHEAGRVVARLEGAQSGIQHQPAEPEQRKGVRGIWHVPITAGRQPPGQCAPRYRCRREAAPGPAPYRSAGCAR